MPSTDLRHPKQIKPCRTTGKGNMDIASGLSGVHAACKVLRADLMPVAATICFAGLVLELEKNHHPQHIFRCLISVMIIAGFIALAPQIIVGLESIFDSEASNFAGTDSTNQNSLQNIFTAAMTQQQSNEGILDGLNLSKSIYVGMCTAAASTVINICYAIQYVFTFLQVFLLNICIGVSPVLLATYAIHPTRMTAITFAITTLGVTAWGMGYQLVNMGAYGIYQIAAGSDMAAGAMWVGYANSGSLLVNTKLAGTITIIVPTFIAAIWVIFGYIWVPVICYTILKGSVAQITAGAMSDAASRIERTGNVMMHSLQSHDHSAQNTGSQQPTPGTGTASGTTSSPTPAATPIASSPIPGGTTTGGRTSTSGHHPGISSSSQQSDTVSQQAASRGMASDGTGDNVAKAIALDSTIAQPVTN